MDFNLSAVEQMIVKSAKDFCDREIMPVAEQIVEENDYPPDLMEKFAKARMLGMTVPKEYGGVASNNVNVMLIAEELGKTGTACFWPFAMNNSVAETINAWGSEDVKKTFIPSLCDGSGFGSMAFTEPGTGSDPRSITTAAVLDGDEYVVNGTKRFITVGNKPGCGVFYLKDASLKGDKADVTALIVDKTSPGYTTSEPWQLMGLEGMNLVDVFFKDVRVPAGNVLGKPGHGFGYLLKWVAGERAQQSSYMTGIGQAALDEAVNYAKSRMVGGKPQGYMQGIQWMLCDMNIRVDACRCLTRKTAFMQDDGQAIEAISAGLKTFVVPTIQEVVRMAMQIHGSYGYAKEYKVEKLYRYAAHGGVVATSTELNKTIAGMSLLR